MLLALCLVQALGYVTLGLPDEELEQKILQLERHNEELQKENKQLKIELEM